MIDQGQDLEPLAKFLRCVDPTVLQLVVCRHVDAIVREEPEDEPPGAGYFTPDRGYTWIRFTIKEKERHRLLGRLLAFLYSGNAHLFYQLIAESKSRTALETEEEAYQEKTRRLEHEGIPSSDTVQQVNAPLDPAGIQLEVEHSSQPRNPSVLPLVYDRFSLDPLESVLLSASTSRDSRDTIEAELSLIMNSSLLGFGVDLGNPEEVVRHLARVRGAINIGIEAVAAQRSSEAAAVFQQVGLQRLYRVGLFELRRVRNLLSRLPEERLQTRTAEDPALGSLFTLLLADFPEVPQWFDASTNLEAVELELLKAPPRAISHLAELRALEALIKGELLH